jgi:hypothetical protein
MVIDALFLSYLQLFSRDFFPNYISLDPSESGGFVAITSSDPVSVIRSALECRVAGVFRDTLGVSIGLLDLDRPLG